MQELKKSFHHFGHVDCDWGDLFIGRDHLISHFDWQTMEHLISQNFVHI